MTPRTAIPTTLVSGYLGAGKSTFINRLLGDANGQRITVLVNDFGEIAIDEELIANQSGDTLALTNGCMCCSIGGALFDAIDKILRSDPQPDHLVIETSGVADPGKVAQIAIAERELDYAGCFTLVDAANFVQQLEAKYISDTVERQVAKSDVVGISKSDLVEPALCSTLLEKLSKINPDATTITINHGQLPFEFLQEKFTTARNSAAISDHHAVPETAHQHSQVYDSWSHESNKTCSIEHLRQISDPKCCGIYRMKGYLKTDADRLYIVHRVGTDFQYQESHHPDRRTRLVAIGPANVFSSSMLEQEWQARCRS